MKTSTQKGVEKIEGKKEENSAPPVGLEPTTSCLHDKGTTTRAKGETEATRAIRGRLKW